jgi:hypothetical protein
MIPSYAQADTPIDVVANKVAEAQIDCCFLVPTATGMDKSIMDAVAPVRSFLRRSGFHDFETQEQGADHKRVSTCVLTSGGYYREEKVSLYRPTTKDGDPRIWFYNLRKFCVPGKLLLLVVENGMLWVWNASE